MKNIIHIISLLAFCLFTQTEVLAKDTTPIKKIYFTEEANWPPFTPNQYGKTQEGLSYALMEEIFSRLDIKVSLDLLPQKRMLKYLKEGKKDGVTVISKNASREEFLNYSEPIFQKKGFIYYLKDNIPDFSWEKYEDLQGLTIGVVDGHNLGSEFSNAIKIYNLHIQTVSQAQQNFDMLLNRRVDIILSIEPTANHFLKDPKYGDKIGRASKEYYSKYYHIGLIKKPKLYGLLPKVNQIIIQMKADGSLKKLLSQYSLSF